MTSLVSISSALNPSSGAERPIYPTPAGAYFAVSDREDTPLRAAMFALLISADPTQRTSCADESRFGAPTPPDASIVNQLLQLGWAATADRAAEYADSGSLEQVLPDLLAALSGDGCALLADQQGLQMAVAGFDERQAQGLAALSSEAVALGERHRRLVASPTVASPAAWAMVDAAGNSQLGVWPLFTGPAWFALVIRGRPRFAQPAFLHLVRSLLRRSASPIPQLLGMQPGSVS